MSTVTHDNPIYTYGFIGDYNIFSPMYRSLNGMPIVTYLLIGGTTLLLTYVTFLDGMFDNTDAARRENKPFTTNYGGKRKTAKNNQNNRKSRKQS